MSAVVVQRPRARPRARASRTAYLFLLPFLVVFALSIAIPLGYAVTISFFRKQLVGGLGLLRGASDVVIEVLPLRPDAPIHLPGWARPAPPGDGGELRSMRVERVERRALPEPLRRAVSGRSRGRRP